MAPSLNALTWYRYLVSYHHLEIDRYLDAIDEEAEEWVDRDIPDTVLHIE